MDVIGRDAPLTIDCPAATDSGGVGPTQGTPTPTPVASSSGGVGPTQGTNSSAPSGGVEGATGRPGVTLPPTDTAGVGATAESGDGVRLILILLAAAIGSCALLTPRRKAKATPVEETRKTH
jgi:hypothetical protein